MSLPQPSQLPAPEVLSPHALLALPEQRDAWLRPVDRQAWQTLQAELQRVRQKGLRRHRAQWWGAAAAVPVGAGLLHLLGQVTFAPAFLAVEVGTLLGIQGWNLWGPWKHQKRRHLHWATLWCTEEEQATLSLPALLSRAQDRLERADVTPEQQAAWEAHPAAQAQWLRIQASDVPVLHHDVRALDRLLQAPVDVAWEEDRGEERRRASLPAWAYVDELDPLSDQLNWHAHLGSLSSIVLESPYDRPLTVDLCVTHHARRGWQVGLRLAEGTGIFSCGVEEVTVRFDQHPMQQWAVKERQISVLSFEHPEAFIEALKQADQVLIEASFYNSGHRMLRYEAADRIQVPAMSAVATPLPALPVSQEDEDYLRWGGLLLDTDR